MLARINFFLGMRQITIEETHSKWINASSSVNLGQKGNTQLCFKHLEFKSKSLQI